MDRWMDELIALMKYVSKILKKFNLKKIKSVDWKAFKTALKEMLPCITCFCLCVEQFLIHL